LYEISKEFTFEAAHQLLTVPEGHKCGRLHGHSYTVVLVLSSDVLDQHGFIVDYGELSEFKDWVDQTLDHRNLNDVFAGYFGRSPGTETTAENLAKFIFGFWTDRWPQLAAVRVSETAKTWAEYRPPLRLQFANLSDEDISSMMHRSMGLNTSAIPGLVDRASTQRLVGIRGAQYGAAWLDTGQWLQDIIHTHNVAQVGPALWGLCAIHNKMDRAAKSPHDPDHYADALGYAQLVATQFNPATDAQVSAKKAMERLVTTIRAASQLRTAASFAQVNAALMHLIETLASRRAL
jgi:6-pyruvoyltetrahydropterin/6-carboxytetrahydropterin synthase